MRCLKHVHRDQVVTSLSKQVCSTHAEFLPPLLLLLLPLLLLLCAATLTSL
jgi:hypothetical protein